MSPRSLSLRAAALAVAAVSHLAPFGIAAADAAPNAKFVLHVSSPQYPLSDKQTARVLVGMTTDQVRGLIGEPWNTIRFDNTHTTSWDYEARDGWGYDAVFSVIFDDAGTVVGKLSVRRDG
jgi:outer membrane protein assembly factor BamE (lipoprotein component of BamABCDE complex)